MMVINKIIHGIAKATPLLTLTFAATMTMASSANAARSGALGTNARSAMQSKAEIQIRNLIEPLLEKYCREECKLMNVSVEVDLDTPDDVAPGFDDVDSRSLSVIVPSAGYAKLLVDEKIGPSSRGRILEHIQQHLDALDYPVKVDTQVARFPQPIGSATKVAELRDRVTKQFRQNLDDLFKQFCPDQCLLADFDLQTELVNAEEAQFGHTGEFIQQDGVALRIKDIAASILIDDALPAAEQQNILAMAKLKTNAFKNVTLDSRNLKFPRPIPADELAKLSGRGGRGLAGSSNSMDSTNKSETNASTSSKSNNETANTNNTNSNNTANNTQSTNTSSTNAESNMRQERFERIEKIERVESGDAVQAELQKFKVFGLIFACSVLSLLIFLALGTYRPKGGGMSTVQRVIQQIAADPVSTSAPSTYKGSESSGSSNNTDRNNLIGKRYEIERIKNELLDVFANQPKVAKQVFSRILTEEGIETTAQYIHIFGESIIIDMLSDPSMQADVSELTEYYAKNPMDLTDDEQLELLKKLHNRTIAGKLVVMGSRSSHLFDFLAEMDGLQIMELIRNESVTVKAIVMTQCDSQKRGQIFSKVDEETRIQLMNELSRIDYLPRDYIFNVANALKRKRRENPKLNTEALPGSEVLLTLLERANSDVQRMIVRNLELSAPESARTIKNKMVSIDSLRHLRDGQLLEVVLSLKHDELLQFLKGAPDHVRTAIFSKSPKDLVAELEEELETFNLISREAYTNIERKVLNRMKVMANEGLINLTETNERLLAESGGNGNSFIDAGPANPGQADSTRTDTANLAGQIKKVSGW